MVHRSGGARDFLLLLLLIAGNGVSSAPSKAAAPPTKPLLGRPGTNLKTGLVGMPNVGKSSFFNVLCNMAVPAENFPFCTIDPSVSRVGVPDARFEWLCDTYAPKSRIQAHLQVTDIAGLVRGAAEGQGLGNEFLSHIAATDCVFHMVRVFDDSDISHVEDTVDPVRDMEIITSELRAKDVEWAKARLEHANKAARNVKGGSASKEAIEVEMVTKILKHLEGGKDIRAGDWSVAEVELLNEMLLLTSKPYVWLLNLSEGDYVRKKNKWLPKIKEWVDSHGGGALIPVSVALEQKLQEMGGDERAAYLQEAGCVSCLPKVISSGLQALDMQCFFTVGADEVRAWGVRKGSKAPQAAGMIHSDFERGFIMAETIAYDDLKEHGTETAVKAAGKYRMEGKQYVCHDGDIFHFKFNVSPPSKKK